MTDERPLVSIVCPAFQEDEVLPLFHRELAAHLRPLETDYQFEVLYVDDGSWDGTLDVIKMLAAQDPRIAYLSLSRNFGHQAALLTAGLEHARGDAVISMDSDLQHPPRVLPLLLEKWRQGHDVVITIRGDDQRLSLFKRLSSRAFYRAMALLSDTEIRLAASDFRLLCKAVQGLLQMREQHRFVRGMVQWLGFRPAEIVFTPDERRAGQSKYTLRRMLRLAGDGLFSFSRVPLRLATYLGLLAAALGVGQSCWFAVQDLRGVESLPLTMQYLSVVTQVLGGGILCALGFLGEYVGRIHEQVKGRPVYVLKDQSPPPSAAVSRQRDAA